MSYFKITYDHNHDQFSLHPKAHEKSGYHFEIPVYAAENFKLLSFKVKYEFGEPSNELEVCLNLPLL